jgi:hypothetical protein
MSESESLPKIFPDPPVIEPAREKLYTAFWPVFLVFLFFNLTAIWQIVGSVKTKHNLEQALAKLDEGVAQSQAKASALTGLAHDLLELAPSSPVAQQIVTDFKIKVRNQVAPTGASADMPSQSISSAIPVSIPSQPASSTAPASSPSLVPSKP